jgi:hypothetical protein
MTRNYLFTGDIMGLRGTFDVAGDQVNPSSSEDIEALQADIKDVQGAIENAPVKIYDSVNSTSTLLGVDESWTAESWVPVEKYTFANVAVTTDQDAAVGGLEILFSQDGVTEMLHRHKFSPKQNYTQFGRHFPSALGPMYYKIKYTNGGVAQAVFELSTTLLVTSPEDGHAHDLNSFLDDDHSAPVRRVVLAGKPPSGLGYLNLRASESGGLFTHPLMHLGAEVSLHMTRDTGLDTTLSSSASKGDRVISLTSVGSLAKGNKIKIINGATAEYDFLTVAENLSGLDVTLDRVLDIDHPVGTAVKSVSPGMAVEGTPSSPIRFSYIPRVGERKLIRTIHITIATTGEPALNKFGGITALGYGLHFKLINAAGRDETYWIPFRSNNSMHLSGFTYHKEPKVGTTWYTHMSLDIVGDASSAIPVTNDIYFVCDVQDDLTGLESMEIKLGVQEELENL